MRRIAVLAAALAMVVIADRVSAQDMGMVTNVAGGGFSVMSPPGGPMYYPPGSAPNMMAPPIGAPCEPADSTPCFTINASALILSRSPALPRMLAQTFDIDSQQPGPAVIDARDLDLGWRVGPRLETTVRICCGWDVDTVFYGINNWADTKDVIAPDGLFLYAPLLNDTTVFDEIAARYESALYNGELTLRRHFSPNLTGLIGFRYVSLQEKAQLFATSFSSGATADEIAKVKNDLYGLQVGLDLKLGSQEPRSFFLNGFVKAGVFGNQAILTQTTETTVDGAPPFTEFHAVESRVAFVGEAALLPSYRLSDHIVLFGGYEALWLQGVALAVEHFGNPSNSSPDNIITGVHPSKTVFYHGALLGVQLQW
jgi:hypothetical protein